VPEAQGRVHLDDAGVRVAEGILEVAPILLVTLLQYGEDQGFLGRVVVQQPGLGDADPRGDVRQARAAETGLGEGLRSRGEDLLPPLRARQAQSRDAFSRHDRSPWLPSVP
jgi:hypothetical protein